MFFLKIELFFFLRAPCLSSGYIAAKTAGSKAIWVIGVVGAGFVFEDESFGAVLPLFHLDTRFL